MTNLARLVVSLAISGVCLYFAARGVAWDEAWAAVARVRRLDLVGLFLVASGSLVFRALRWQVLLEPIQRVPFWSLLSATSIGFAANMVLPLRAGEVIRPWLLTRREGVPFASAVATVALERLFDMGTLVLFFSIASATLPLPPAWRGYAGLFFGVFGGFLCVVVGLRLWPERAMAVLRFLLRPLSDDLAEKIMSLAETFAAGLGSLGLGRPTLLAIAYSLATWAAIGGSFAFAITAFQLDVPLGEASLAVTAFVAIAVSIPGGPGFVGQFQVGAVTALRIYGISEAVAFSYSVVAHLGQFLGTVVPGGYFAMREGVSAKDLGAARAAGDGKSNKS